MAKQILTLNNTFSSTYFYIFPEFPSANCDKNESQHAPYVKPKDRKPLPHPQTPAQKKIVTKTNSKSTTHNLSKVNIFHFNI